MWTKARRYSLCSSLESILSAGTYLLSSLIILCIFNCCATWVTNKICTEWYLWITLHWLILGCFVTQGYPDGKYRGVWKAHCKQLYSYAMSLASLESGLSMSTFLSPKMITCWYPWEPIGDYIVSSTGKNVKWPCIVFDKELSNSRYYSNNW